MSRVWIGWAGVVGVVLLLWIGLGFFGTSALQYGLPVIALTAGALLLPSGELWWKGLCLLGGVLVAMIGFLLGAGLLPDTPVGYTLGAVVPVTIVALATMWTKKVSYFLAGVFGVAAFQAVYTAPFLSDPQSINVSMPQAFGITLAPMALTYLVFTVLAVFVPRFAKDGAGDTRTGTDTSATAVETEPSTAGATSTTTTTTSSSGPGASASASAESPTVVNESSSSGSHSAGRATVTQAITSPASQGSSPPTKSGENSDSTTTTQMGVKE